MQDGGEAGLVHRKAGGGVGLVVGRGGDHEVIEVEHGPVEHDGRDDLMDAEARLEEARYGADQRAARDARQDDHGNLNGGGQVELGAYQHRAHGAGDVLALCTEVEQAGLEREGDRDAREDDGRGLDDGVGDVLGFREDALEQRGEGGDGVVARDGKRARCDQKSQDDGDKGRGDGLLQDLLDGFHYS